MLEEEIEQAYEIVIRGEEAKAWLDGPLGKYVLKQRADVERKVLEQFRLVDAGNPKKIRDLQRALDAANTGVQWLLDAIQMGSQQEQILKAERDEL